MPRPTRAPLNLMTISDAAEYLGCSTKTIRRRIAEGSIAAYRAPGGGRLMRIDRDQFEAALTPVTSTTWR